MRNKTIGATLLALSFAFLVACSGRPTTLDDGYQVGDVTRQATTDAFDLLMLRFDYCHAEDDRRRRVALELLKTLYPEYPENGICTDLDKLFGTNIGIEMDGAVEDPK